MSRNRETQPQHISLIAAWGLARRYLIRMKRSMKSLIVTLLTPLILLFVFGPAMNMVSNINLGSSPQPLVGYMNFFVPGIIALNLFYAAMFSASNVVQVDKFTHFEEIVDMTPNSPRIIILGYALGGLIYTIFEVFLIVVICAATTTLVVPIEYIPFNILTSFLVIGFFLFLSIAIAKTVDWEHYTLILSVLTLPVVYLSNIFAPTSTFGPLNWLVTFNPISILLDGYRASLMPLTLLQPMINIFLLLGYCMGAFLLCLYVFNRVPHPPAHHKKKDTPLSRMLQKTERIYTQVVQKLGQTTLGIIYQLLLAGKKEEAIALFRTRFTGDEIQQLFDALTLAKN